MAGLQPSRKIYNLHPCRQTPIGKHFYSTLTHSGIIMVFGSVNAGSYHMSICVEYSEDPSRTSGGRYQRVTTSLEYVLVGTDLARARPAGKNGHTSTNEDFVHSIKKAEPVLHGS